MHALGQSGEHIELQRVERGRHRAVGTEGLGHHRLGDGRDHFFYRVEDQHANRVAIVVGAHFGAQAHPGVKQDGIGVGVEEKLPSQVDPHAKITAVARLDQRRFKLQPVRAVGIFDSTKRREDFVQKVNDSLQQIHVQSKQLQRRSGVHIRYLSFNRFPKLPL